MADDFRVNVQADLDASEAEQKLNKLINEPRKIKVSLEIDKSAEMQAKDLVKGIERGLKSTKLDTGGMAKQLAAGFNINNKNVVSKLKSQMDSILDELAKSWNGKQFVFNKNNGFISGLDAMAETVSKNAKVIQDKMGIYDQFYSYFKDKKIYISDELKSAMGEDLYKEISNANIGKIVRDATKGVSIDSIWNEMTTLFPEHFASDITNQVDQIVRAFDILKAARADVARTLSFDDMTPKQQFDIKEQAYGDIVPMFNRMLDSLKANINSASDELKSEFEIDVKVNTDNIISDVKNALSQAGAGSGEAIKVNLDINQSEIETQIRNAIQSISSSDTPMDIKLDVSRQSLEADLQAALHDIDLPVQFRVDASDIENQIRAAVSAIDDIQMDVHVNVDNIREEINRGFNNNPIDIPIQSTNTNTSRRTGADGETVFSALGGSVREAFQTFTVANLMEDGIYKTIDAGKQGIETVKSLDDAMLDLQNATGESKTNVQNMMQSYNALGQELGALTTEVSSSADTFLRQGRSIEETNQLIKDSMVLSKIGQIDSGTSSEILTSTINGFQMMAQEASHVNDVLSSIDLASASSVEGIGKALTKSASIANNTGLSLEKTAAIIATIKDITQDSDDAIGNSVKSILSRMNNVKAGKFVDSETGEALNDVEKVLNKIGASMRDNNGQFRSSEEIIDNVAAKWKSLDKISQKAVVTAMGGTYQANRLTTLFDNYDKVQKLTAIANNSEGAAEAKFANYTDSLEAKTKSLQASLEALASDTLSGEMYAGFLDAAKGMADFAKETDLVKTALAGLGTAGATYAFTQLSTMLSNTITQVANLGGGLSGLWGVLSAHPVGLVTVGVTAAVGAWNAYQKSVQEAVNSAKQAGSEWEKSNSSIQSNIEKITELRTALDSGKLTEQEAYDVKSQLLEIQSSLTEAYGLEAGSLDLVNGKYDEQIAKLKELADIESERMLNENQEGIKEARRQMEKESRTYLGQSFSSSWKDADKLQSILDKYKGKGINAEEDSYGRITVYFEGDASQAYDTLNSFMTDIRHAMDETGNVDLFEGFYQDASDRLNESKDILKEYQGLYNQAMKADLQTDRTDFGGKTAAEWLNNYAKAVENYNDAVASGSTEEVAKANDYYNKINQSVQVLLKGSDLSQYSALFADVSVQLDKAAIKANEFNAALNTDSSDKFLNGYQKHIQSVVDDIQKLDMSDVDFKIAVNTGDIEPISYLKQQAEAAGISTDALVDSLINLGVLSGNPSGTVEEVSSSLDNFRTSVESAIEAQDNLKSAFISSKSATGLTTEEIENVTSAYKDLEGFDAETLFEKTANGVHLNTDAMKLLNEQLEATTKQGYLEQIAAKQKEINDLLSENPQADVSGLEAELSTLLQLSAQYDAATSAYNKFIKTQSGGNERDSYENVGKSYESMKETLEQGWYGDESLNSYLDLMLSVSQRTGDAQADFEKLNQTIEGTNHSLLDYWSYEDDKLVTDGLFDFLDDVNAKLGDEYAKIDESGKYAFDFTGDKLQEVADLFGTTPEMIQLFERAMIDAGMAVELGGNDLNDYASKMDELTQKTDAAKEKLKEMQKKGSGQISTSLNLDYNAAEMSLDEIQSKIDELKQERITVEATGDTEGLQAIDDEISALENQKIYMSIQAQVDSGTSIDELLAIEDDKELSAKLNIDTSQVDEARKQLESLNGQIAKASVSVNEQQNATVAVTPEQEEIEIKVKDATVKVTPNPEEVEVSVKSVPVQTDNVEGQTDGITVKVHMDDTEEKAYQPQDKEATVTFDKDSVIPDDYVAPDKSALVKYGVYSHDIDLWTPPTKTGTVVYKAQVSGLIPSTAGKADGTLTPAHASGTAYNVLNMKPAYANGKVALDKNEQAVVNELGTEGIIRNGRLFAIPGGMHMENLKKGDIILSAKQMKALFSGKDAGHARAYASGTLTEYGINAYDSGTGGTRRPSSGSNTATLSGNTSKDLEKAASDLSSSADSISTASESLSDLIKKISDNVKDWIETLISRTESKIDLYKAISENKSSINQKNKNITLAETLTGKEVKYYKDAYKKYMAYADNVASQVGLSAELKKKVQEGIVDIQQLSEDELSKVEAYSKWYDKAIAARQSAEEKYAEQVELAAQKLSNILDVYDSYINKNKTGQDLVSAKLDYRETSGMTISPGSGYTKLIQQQIAYEKSNIAMLKAEYNAYKKQLAEYGKKYGTESTAYREMQANLTGVGQALYESMTSLTEWTKTLDESREQISAWRVDKYSRVSDKLDAATNYKEVADGYTVTEQDYREQIKNNNSQISALYREREQKAKSMEKYAYNSEEYQKYADEISQLDVEILNLSADNEELKNSMMELRWKPFDDAQEKLSNVVSEYDSLRSLMDSDTFISESDGSFTENGLTNLLLLQESIDATKTKMANYRKQIDNLNEQYANGNWSQEEYNEKLKELQDGLLDSAKAAETYKQSILDLYEEQLQKKNELMQEDITGYKNALDAKKKYHDYDKQLKNQTKELNILKAQAAALEGVTDASSKARLAKIKAQIADAEDELEETRYNHEYEMKSDAYDQLSEDIDKNLDNTLNSLRTNPEMQNQVIDSMLAQVTTSYESTFSNLDSIVENHGLVLSETFNNSLDSVEQKLKEVLEQSKSAYEEVSNVFNTGSAKDTKADTAVQGSNNTGLKVLTSGNTSKVADTVNNSNNSLGGGTGIEYVSADKVILDQSRVTMFIGDKITLKANVIPENAPANFTWSSSSPKVAKVLNTGVVTAVSKGTAIITVEEARSKKKSTCKVTVVEKPGTFGDLGDKKPASTTPSTTTTNTGSDKSNGTDIWSGIAKDASMKGNKSLNKDVSIVDRMAYYGYKSDNVARTQLWKNLKGSGTYSGTATQNTWMIQQLKKVGYANGGFINRYIQIDPNSEAAKYVYQNGDNAIITARAGEYILPEDMANRIAPTVQTMETFNDNIRKYASYNNENSNSVVHYDSLITVNGNVDKDVMSDLKSLSKQLVNNREFVKNMTGKISTNLANDAYTAGVPRRIL